MMIFGGFKAGNEERVQAEVGLDVEGTIPQSLCKDLSSDRE